MTKINTLRPRQNGRHFTDDTVKCIFLNENVRISIKIFLKFVPKGPINNIPALVQIMPWHWSGDMLLSEPMMVNLLTHICIIGSNNGLSPGQRQAIIWTNAGILLLAPLGTNFSEILIKIYTFSVMKIHLKCRLWNGGHFISAPMCLRMPYCVIWPQYMFTLLKTVPRSGVCKWLTGGLI